MPIPVILPKFGFTLETADIVQWLVKEGDTVHAGDPICEVTTDKVNMEVEAPEDGTIIGLQYPAGTTVPVTKVICYLLRPGESDSIPTAAFMGETSHHDSPFPQAESGPGSEVSVSPIARRMAEAASIRLDHIHGTGPSGKIMRRDVESALAQGNSRGKVRATPAARRIARESGIALETVAGSGPHGRIQGSDVVAAQKPPQPLHVAPPVIGTATEPVPQYTQLVMPKVVKLEGMRKTIAARLQKSFQTAPHIFFDAQIDMMRIEALRRHLKARDEKLSVTAILVKACTWALQKHPWLNATIEGDAVSLWPTVNMGVAVALDQGLVVPVIHGTERLALSEIQRAVDALTERARSNTLHLNDVMDGTFTISNLGMYGVDRFTAIINPPQVAILAVGRIVRQFVPDDKDQPVLRPLMSITLSADHRVVDGANAALFLSDLRIVLEEPALMAW